MPATRNEYTYHFKCDVCGYESTDSTEFNEIILQMDPEECVSYAFRRILCWREGKIWKKLCAVIGADPDDESKSDFEDG